MKNNETIAFYIMRTRSYVKYQRESFTMSVAIKNLMEVVETPASKTITMMWNTKNVRIILYTGNKNVINYLNNMNFTWIETSGVW